MHYLTLVAIDIGEYEISPIEDETVKLAIEQLTAYKSQTLTESIYAKCRISALKSLSNSFARRVTARVADRLEPYCRMYQRYAVYGIYRYDRRR